jgi:hypothetical protein
MKQRGSVATSFEGLRAALAKPPPHQWFVYTSESMAADGQRPHRLFTPATRPGPKRLPIKITP